MNRFLAILFSFVFVVPAYSAISFVAGDQATNAATQSLTVTLDAAVTTDDLMVGLCKRDENGTAARWSTVTSGWIEEWVLNADLGRDQEVGFFYKVATSASETDPAFDTNAGTDEESTCSVVTFRGIDTGTPWDVTFVEGSHYTGVDDNINPTNQPITTVTNGAWILIWQSPTHNDITVYAVPSTPSGLTIRDSLLSSGNDMKGTVIATAEISTAGLVTPTAWQNTGAPTNITDNALVTLAIRPAVAGGSAAPQRRRQMQ